MMGWQWHQLDHMQIICTSFHADNHASTSSLTHLMLFLTSNQQRQNTEGKTKLQKRRNKNNYKAKCIRIK